MDFTTEQLNFLIFEEGKRNYVYKDSKKLDTFGIGHLLIKGQDDYLKAYTEKKQSTDKLVFDIFKKDIESRVKFLDNLLKKNKISLNSNQYTALFSMMFNIGNKGLETSFLFVNLKENLKNKNFEKIKEHFTNWSSGGILKDRRIREFNFFMKPVNSTVKKINVAIALVIISFAIFKII